MAPPSRQSVRSMVGALFTLTARLERAKRQRHAAGALDLLQVVAGVGADGARPSHIAALQSVHRSQVTRQVRELEDADLVSVAGDPEDGRSWLVTLTPAGWQEMLRLQEIGLDRFALFVADWDDSEVRALAALLDKLMGSMAAAGERERPGLGGTRVARRERIRVRAVGQEAGRADRGRRS